jgi:hypothetical protein
VPKARHRFPHPAIERGYGDEEATMPGKAGTQESTEFWARQFARQWYRGTAHLENDFRRFATAYRVPAHTRARLRGVIEGLVGGGSPRAA